MSFTARVIVGLAAGLAAGMGLAAAGPGWWQHVPAVVEPFGTLFVNATRMTVIPLVASGLIVGVASMPSAGAVGRLGSRALLLFVALSSSAVLFVARLYDVPLSSAQLATVVLTVIVTSFTIPGIPAGAIITMTPVLAAAGSILARGTRRERAAPAVRGLRRRGPSLIGLTLRSWRIST